VLIDWNDNKKRKAFREALEKVYPSVSSLRQFTIEELDKSLTVVAGEGKDSAFDLIERARSQGQLDEVYGAFKQDNPHHDSIKIIERQSFVSKSSSLAPNDWQELFENFLPDDLADLQRAFKQGFRAAIGIDFHQAQPKYPPLVEVVQIRELLEEYDANDQGPILAVRFVEFAIEQLSLSSQHRDLMILQRWRDRIAASFQVAAVAIPPSQPMARHAYLLVTVEESGAKVILYPELHITGEDHPIEFGAILPLSSISIDQVADWVSKWIRQAEEKLLDIDICDDGQVTLEVFLPGKYLEEDIAFTWFVQNKRNKPIALGVSHRFVVRSTDRVRDQQTQKALKVRWSELQKSNTCQKFHVQADCPPIEGMLSALLHDKGAHGLKFVAELPTEPVKRQELLNEIIDAAFPFALWASEMADFDAVSLKAEFDTLLKGCCLTDFRDLARQWRMQRNFSAAKYIKLLCDRPDRLPQLPDLKNREDTDAIVAY
jgi:vWA-MoxR associated protein C-terminal domain/Effector-associated domain 1